METFTARRAGRLATVLATVLAVASTVALTSTPASGAVGRPEARLAPANGTLFGAYVDPDNRWVDNQTAEGEVETFEHQLGRKLDIDQHYYSWTNTFPSGLEQWDMAHGRIPLISWQGTDLDEINSGRWDAMLRNRASDVARLNKPLFIRWGYEMNGNWNPVDGTHNSDPGTHNGPAKYVAAWRHIHNIFDNQGATNVVWVWCPNNTDVPGNAWNHWAKYYPGGQFVDWVGIDGYNWGKSMSWSSWYQFGPIVRDVYDDYATSKPIMIAETGSAETGGDKGAWMQSARNAIKTSMPAIAAFVYFDVNKETDWRANSSASAFNSFKDMAADPYFNGSPHGGGGGSDLRLTGVSAAPDTLVKWSAISYTINEPANIRVRILNESGTVIRHRLNENYAAGSFSVRWRGLNDNFNRVQPGRYTAQVVATDRAGNKKRAFATVDVA